MPFYQLSYTFHVDTLSSNRSATVPTVTDNLFSEGTIPLNQFGVYFVPLTNSSDIYGEITWGLLHLFII